MRTQEKDSLVVAKCIGCKKNIEAGATVCAECNSYQSSWRNELKYWSNINAILILAFSGLAFISGFLIDVSNYLAKSELKILELDSFARSSIANTSRDRVVIKTIGLSSPRDDIKLSYVINESVDPGRVYNFDLQKLSEEQIKHDLGREYSGKFVKEYITFCANQTFDEALASKGLSAKAVLSFVLKGGATDIFVRSNHANDACVADCAIKVSYIEGMLGRDREREFPCTGYMRVYSP